ncbi:MAG: hypothetical protein EZS28_004864 [Streblomastix strix]|uniref:Uncharacterized protein n=1 Tax=Streblomastix strix TaxID=222440 RepID=A0A5J4WXS4_9EUKA|nr:MAG: hypothetical protein EZS28_004864 [Streblomastix strix]
MLLNTLSTLNPLLRFTNDINAYERFYVNKISFDGRMQLQEFNLTQQDKTRHRSYTPQLKTATVQTKPRIKSASSQLVGDLNQTREKVNIDFTMPNDRSIKPYKQFRPASWHTPPLLRTHIIPDSQKIIRSGRVSENSIRSPIYSNQSESLRPLSATFQNQQIIKAMNEQPIKEASPIQIQRETNSMYPEIFNPPSLLPQMRSNITSYSQVFLYAQPHERQLDDLLQSSSIREQQINRTISRLHELEEIKLKRIEDDKKRKITTTFLLNG